MDIPKLSMELAMNSTQTRVGTAVLGKMIDSNEQMGDRLVQMIDAAAMERSMNPTVGSHLDVSL